MASSRISEQNPPNIDVTRSSVAYGDRAIPKLKRELAGDDDQVRLQALRSLCDKLRNPMNVKEATDEGSSTIEQLMLLTTNLQSAVLGSLHVCSVAAKQDWNSSKTMQHFASLYRTSISADLHSSKLAYALVD
eukprot:m.132311 g.132311  ORF g.132311 m.132311 type:complete len:133 (-) comp13932_c0_seq2:1562-1960(-)